MHHWYCIFVAAIDCQLVSPNSLEGVSTYISVVRVRRHACLRLRRSAASRVAQVGRPHRTRDLCESELAP